MYIIISYRGKSIECRLHRGNAHAYNHMYDISADGRADTLRIPRVTVMVVSEECLPWFRIEAAARGSVGGCFRIMKSLLRLLRLICGMTQLEF